MITDKNHDFYGEAGTVMNIIEDLRTGIKTVTVLLEKISFGYKQTNTIRANYNELKVI
jgi:hypothetical protein